MKLNLGCGGNYKKDYLNVDAFDSTIADGIMSASDLKLGDNVVDEIYASQLIEHLGIVGSRYSLSECFRVLKPKAKLILETPDLRKTFEGYLDGDREARKNLLPWIHGVDMPGMIHRFCYPDDLLEETLKEIGFININKESFEIESYQPILKIFCEKPDDYQAFQFIASFRKKLLQKEIVDLDDQIISLEKDDLIVFFTEKIEEFIRAYDRNILNEIFVNGAIKSPVMTRIFFQEMQLQNLISKELFEEYLEVLNVLIEISFPDILVNILKQTSGFVGEQDQLFSSVCGLGIKTVEKLLRSEEKNELIKNLKDTSKNIKSNEKIAFLSLKLIMLKANRFFQIGSKEFILNNYEKAISNFTVSSNLYRNQILTYWNLGRLYNLQGKTDDANSYYRNALRLTDIFDYDQKTIKQALEQEKSGHDIKKYDGPITSLTEI